MSPALQTLLDTLGVEQTNPDQLERNLGGTSGIQLSTLAGALQNVDLGILATLPQALQDVVNIALNSTTSNLSQLQYELGGADGVQLAILGAVMSQSVGGSAISNPYIAYVRLNGNDDTAEVGNPAKPFETGTAAFAALKELHDDPDKVHTLHLGVGEFFLDLTPVEVAASYNLYVSGDGGPEGIDRTSILTIRSYGASGADGPNGAEITETPTYNPDGQGGQGFGGNNGEPGLNGDDLNISLFVRSNLSALIYFELQGGAGGNGGAGGLGGPGGDGLDGQGPTGPDGSLGVGGNGGDTSGNVSVYGVQGNFIGCSAGEGGIGAPNGVVGNHDMTVNAKMSDIFTANIGFVVATCVDNVFNP